MRVLPATIGILAAVGGLWGAALRADDLSGPAFPGGWGGASAVTVQPGNPPPMAGPEIPQAGPNFTPPWVEGNGRATNPAAAPGPATEAPAGAPAPDAAAQPAAPPPSDALGDWHGPSVPSRFPAVAPLPDVRGEPPHAPLYDDFEGPQPSWRPAGSDAQYRIEFQQRVSNEAHTGRQSEFLRVRAVGGTAVYFTHDVGAALVIDELVPSVWLKSDRAGLQVFAEVVFPRSKNPRTGQTLFTLVAGSSYSRVGAWQQLRVDDLPRLIARQVVALRAELGPKIDEHEAFVRRLVLNVYGGPGVTNVWIDDLEMTGYVARPSGPDPGDARPTPAAPWSAPGPAASGPGASAPSNFRLTGRSVDSEPERRAAAQVQLSGATLLVNGRPIMPRVVQYQGEPLQFLAHLGFNAIWLPQPAPAELLAEAEQTEMWIICPPPDAEQLSRRRDEIDGAYNRVLVWDMGRELFTEQLDATRRAAESVRHLSRNCPRPLVGQPECDLKQYSRYLDLLLLGRRPAGTSLELTDYGTWLRNRPLSARPGTPVWATVQTQFAPALCEQLRVLEPDRAPPTVISSEQLRLLVYTAVISGSKGLLFESYSPLSANDAETQQRAAALEMINDELSVIEPWIAAGTLVSTVGGAPPPPAFNIPGRGALAALGIGATTPPPEIVGAIFRVDRARLLLPIWSAAGAQFVPGQAAGNNVALLVPDVPESSTCYELLPGSARPLKSPRVAGGTQITLDEFGLATQILVAQDPAVVAKMTTLTGRVGPRLTELQYQLTASKLDAVQRITGELGHRVSTPRSAGDWLSAAKAQLENSQKLFSERQFDAAYLSAQRSMRALRLLERAYWDGVVGKFTSPVVSPATVSFATLPWQGRMSERIANSHPGANLVAGGDFEDLQRTLNCGWQHFQHRSDGIVSVAEVVPAAAHSGTLGLRLSAQAANAKAPPALVETPPLWVISPPVHVQAGDLVNIQGWVQIRAPLTGTVDGLMIFDSLAGDALAERIGRTAGWRQFSLYRLATHPGTFQVTIALSGLGEALIDDVSVNVLEPGPAPAATRPGGFWPFQR